MRKLILEAGKMAIQLPSDIAFGKTIANNNMRGSHVLGELV